MIERHLEESLLEALEHFPVVALTGARQVGKSTLALSMASKKWKARYLTLDDRVVLDAALRDPDGFVSGTPTPVIFDEIQKAPDLLRAIKRSVDTNRLAGQYLLTGSANLMTLSSISETLAGRVALYELYPFCWTEIRSSGRPQILDIIFKTKGARDFIASFQGVKASDRKREIEQLIISGGYPTPALMKQNRIRQKWFESYRQTYIERDIRNISAIDNLSDFNRILNSVAIRTGQMLNVSDLSRDLGIPLTTLRRYMNILEVTFQIFLLRPYFANIGKRLVKTPKVYFGDTGMACHLTASDDFSILERQGRSGALVETWVANELRKLISLSATAPHLYYWRTHAGQEVDFLLEKGERIVAVEVKWTQRIEKTSIANLKRCASDLGKKIVFSMVLYTGTDLIALDTHTVAIPFGLFFGAA